MINVEHTGAGYYRSNDRGLWWMVSAALVAGASIWFALNPHGAGTSPDSAGYVSAARSLLSEGILVRFDGTPLVEQPPLYPIVLAVAAALTRLDPLRVAPFVQVVLAACAAALTVGIVFRFVTRLPGLLLATLIVAAIGAPLVDVALMVWTELLFVVLVLGALYCGLALLQTPLSYRWLVALGMAAGASAVTRYAGLFVVAWSIGAVLVANFRHVSRGVTRAALVGGVALLPLAVWAVRNLLLGMPALGPRFSADATLPQGFEAVGRTLGGWVSPTSLSTAFALGLAMLFVGCLGVWLILGGKPRPPCYTPRMTVVQWSMLLAMPAGYLLFIVLLSVYAAFDPLANRLLVPAFLPLWIVAVGVATVFLRVEHAPRVTASVAGGAAVVAVLSLAAVVGANGAQVIGAARLDARGFSSTSWRNSPLGAEVRRLSQDCTLRSNNPEALYLITGQPSTSSPARTPYRSSVLLREIERWPPADRTCLVWFTSVARAYLYELRELRARTAGVELVSAADGIVLGVPAERFAADATDSSRSNSDQ